MAEDEKSSNNLSTILKISSIIIGITGGILACFIASHQFFISNLNDLIDRRIFSRDYINKIAESLKPSPIVHVVDIDNQEFKITDAIGTDRYVEGIDVKFADIVIGEGKITGEKKN